MLICGAMRSCDHVLLLLCCSRCLCCVLCCVASALCCVLVCLCAHLLSCVAMCSCAVVFVLYCVVTGPRGHHHGLQLPLRCFLLERGSQPRLRKHTGENSILGSFSCWASLHVCLVAHCSTCVASWLSLMCCTVGHCLACLASCLSLMYVCFLCCADLEGRGHDLADDSGLHAHHRRRPRAREAAW